MRHKNLAVGLAAAAALAGPQLASANSSAVCLTEQNAVEIGFTNFALGGTYERSYQVDVDGVPFRSETVSFAGPGTTVTVPLPAPGPSQAIVRASIEGRVLFDGACGPKPPPPVAPPKPPKSTPPPVAPPPVAPPKPPKPTPPTVRKIDCDWVRTHYAPRLRPSVERRLGLSCGFKKPPPPTCLALNRDGAGPLWYARLGYSYRCRVTPAVTG